MTRQMTEFEKQAKVLMEELKKVFPTAKTITITYSGEGDSGQIDSIEVDGESLDYGDARNDRIEQIADTMVFAQVSYNNEGGGGEIEVDLEALKVKRREYYNEHVKEYLPTQEAQLW